MLNRFLAALQFLTILPVKRNIDPKDTGRSLVWFPAVGLVIGGCSAVVFKLAKLCGLSPLVSAMAGVLALCLLSGFLHIDGVADTADGFFSSRPREKILDIMRDSRLGTMGAAALFFILGLKWAALCSMPQGMAVRALILAPIAGRTAQVITLAYLPYARKSGGLASVFIPNRSFSTLVVVSLFTIVAAFVAGGVKGLVAIGVSCLAGACFNLWCMAKIDGMTGDTIGAISEIVETVIICVFSSGVLP